MELNARLDSLTNQDLARYTAALETDRIFSSMLHKNSTLLMVIIALSSKSNVFLWDSCTIKIVEMLPLG